MQKVRKILIAQIGQGDYRETWYRNVDAPTESFTAGYSFEAVYQQLCRDVLSDESSDMGEAGENIIMLAGTENSFWGSLCHYFLESSMDHSHSPKKDAQTQRDELSACMCSETSVITDRDICVQPNSGGWISGVGIANIKDESVRREIEAFLSKHSGLGAEFRILILKHGIQERQLNENFQKLREGIESLLNESTGDEALQDATGNDTLIHLCFDISMGYRSLPVYIYTFANYLTRFRKELFQIHIYYGMADYKESLDGKVWSPLVNLQQIEVLMKWIQAIGEFSRHGSVKGLLELLEEYPEWNVVVGKESPIPLKQLFARFDYAVNNNNLKVLSDCIQCIAAIDINVDRYPDFPQEAGMMLESMANDFQKRFCSGGTGFYYGFLTIRLARWYWEQRRIGNAASALQEGMITYGLERYPEQMKIWLNREDISITNHSTREALKKKYIEMANNGDEVMARFNLVKTEIRNVNSHIKLIEVSDADMERNMNVLKELLVYMEEEISSDGDVVHSDGKRSLEERINALLPVYWKESTVFSREQIQGYISLLKAEVIESQKDQQKKNPQKEQEMKKNLEEIAQPVLETDWGAALRILMQEAAKCEKGGCLLSYMQEKPILKELSKRKVQRDLQTSIKCETIGGDEVIEQALSNQLKKQGFIKNLLSFYVTEYKQFRNVIQEIYHEKGEVKDA